MSNIPQITLCRCTKHTKFLPIVGLIVLASPIGFAAAQTIANVPVPIPYYRFTLWADIEPVTVLPLASFLSYTERSWNRPGTNAIETRAYDSLAAESEATISAVRGIGFDEDTWDCWVNHYEDYSWEELVENGIDVYYMALGWTQTMWEESGSAETDDYDWDELSEAQKAAALQLCFTQELWEGVPLTAWSELPQRPAVPAPTPSPTLVRQTLAPTFRPTNTPTGFPSKAPTNAPTYLPTDVPTQIPIATPPVQPPTIPDVPEITTSPPEPLPQLTDPPTSAPLIPIPPSPAPTDAGIIVPAPTTQEPQPPIAEVNIVLPTDPLVVVVTDPPVSPPSELPIVIVPPPTTTPPPVANVVTLPPVSQEGEGISEGGETSSGSKSKKGKKKKKSAKSSTESNTKKSSKSSATAFQEGDNIFQRESIFTSITSAMELDTSSASLVSPRSGSLSGVALSIVVAFAMAKIMM